MLRLETIEFIVVHAGVFHADDALAVALVLAASGREIPVKRCFAVPEDLPDTIVVADIGRGKYDHHQEDAKRRVDGNKYAACGLLYEELQRKLFLTEAARKDFLMHFILPIEDADNGIANNPLTFYIDYINADWDRMDENDDRFMKAVHIFLDLIREAQRREKAVIRAEQILTSSIAKAEKKVVFLERLVPWQKDICKTDNLFVVYYSERKEWTVQCVPKSPDSFDVRCPLAAKEDMEGCVFCHSARFLAVFDSRVHAMKAAVKLAEESEVKRFDYDRG